MGDNEDDEFIDETEKYDLIKIKSNILNIQVKLFTHSLNDSRFLTKLSKYVSIESKYIIVDRFFLEKIITINKEDSFYDVSDDELTIEFLIIQLLKANDSLYVIKFEIDDSQNFSRIMRIKSNISLSYKILDLELILNCEKKQTLIDLGFKIGDQLFWSGYLNQAPKKLLNLKGAESIFNVDSLEDNPKTIIKFNSKFFPSNKPNSNILSCF